jgi:hypothetical protein
MSPSIMSNEFHIKTTRTIPWGRSELDISFNGVDSATTIAGLLVSLCGSDSNTRRAFKVISHTIANSNHIRLTVRPRYWDMNGWRSLAWALLDELGRTDPLTDDEHHYVVIDGMRFGNHDKECVISYFEEPSAVPALA